MKKKITIVSADEILLYQPSILNLYDLLQERFDVSIISFEPAFLGNKKEEKRKVTYIHSGGIAKKISTWTDLLLNAPLKRIDQHIFPLKFRFEKRRRLKEKLLREVVKQAGAHIFIAVDPMPLYVVQQIKGAAHFMSLEIIPDDPYLKKINADLILSVIIQNEMRYRYLFENVSLPTFYIQNAPFLKDKIINPGYRENLLWAGTIVKEFGIFNCFNFIEENPGYTFVCKGAAEAKTRKEITENYQHLLNEKRVVIDDQYLPAKDFIKYLSAFRIGFCFYDIALIRKNFNYATAPSGKLFMYLAAGVPVIASNIPGFKFIADADAGILIDDYLPGTILSAIQKIEANYQKYSDNCYKVFDEFAFDTNARVFMEYLS